MDRMSLRFDGIALAPGIAIGKVMPLHSTTRNQVPEKRLVSDVEAELERFSAALKETEMQLASLRDEVKTQTHSIHITRFPHRNCGQRNCRAALLFRQHLLLWRAKSDEYRVRQQV